MAVRLIGIAGGSGCGKSTVSYGLVDSDPARFEMVNFDDYQKVTGETDRPMLAGMVNWDHPDIIRWESLIADIRQLKAGRPITIETWAHRSNPDYRTSRALIPRTIIPRPMVILEGYLALYNSELNSLYDKSFYFDLDDNTRQARRDKAVSGEGKKYYEQVLEPMHEQYVEPTRANADVVIDVSRLSAEQVEQKIIEVIED